MKKHFKKLTTLLLLLTLVGSIPPVQKPLDKNIETGIPVCGDDLEDFDDLIIGK